MAVTYSRKRPVKKSHYLKVSLLLIAAIAGFGWLLNGTGSDFHDGCRAYATG